MFKKLLLILMVIGSWLTVPFIGRKDFKRYYPAAIFIGAYILLVERKIAQMRKWWIIKERLHPKLWGELPLVIGPFFAGSIWILKLTYGKLWMYLLLNSIADGFFAYPFYTWFKNLGIWRLIRLKQYHLFLLFLVKAILLYMFQAVFARRAAKRSTGERREQNG